MNTLTLKALCEKIALPIEVQGEVLSFYQYMKAHKMELPVDKLLEQSTWDAGLSACKAILGEDPRGIKILTCMLHCALKTYENYQVLHIEDTVFLDTFKCFTRFVKEYHTSFGTYGFDRAFWTVRQLSMTLFRIQELEYELDLHKGEKVISLHIPSDAILKKEKWEDSLQKAHVFMVDKFPSYESAKILCHSWLLSPALKKILSESSNIIQFQNCFTIQEVDYDSQEFMQWVYPEKNIPYSKLPENTSLQRNMKAFLLSGGKVGEAFGYLKQVL